MSPSITRADAKMLGRRAEQPVKGPGDLIAVFVRGALVNTKNARLHHMAEHRYKAGWRERVALTLLESDWRTVRHDLACGPLTGHDGVMPTWNYVPYLPKVVTLACNVGRLMDSVDGLRVACAPIIDALKAGGVIDDDRDSSGHAFTFEQEINRAQRGVIIRVRLK